MSALMVNAQENAQLQTTMVLKSANGNLDIEDAWHWDKTQIIDWLETLAADPELFAVDPEYFDDKSSISAGKDLKLSFVVNHIKHLCHCGILTDPMYCKKVATPGAEDPFNFKYPETTYMGHELPTRSLYDSLGWILSITAIPNGMNPNQNNFCMPLLGLFGRWCGVLLPLDLLPTMLHVAYWTSGNQLRMILGATPGRDQMLWSRDRRVWLKNFDQVHEVWHKDLPGQMPMPTVPPGHWDQDENGLPYVTKIKDRSDYDTSSFSKTKDQDTYWGSRGMDIIFCRQMIYKKYGMVINEPSEHLVNEAGLYEADSGFGRCAETFIFLWMLQQRAAAKPMPTVRGFALKPTVRGAGISSISAYNVHQLSNGLTEPCSKTCQGILMSYFREEEEEKCLFMLDRMDELEGKI